MDPAAAAPADADGGVVTVPAILIGNMILAGWLVAQPQPATTPAELALRNEIVAETVGLLLASSTLGYLLIPLGSDASSFAGRPVGLVLVLMSVLLRLAHGGRVRRRLWKQRTPVPGT